MTARARWSYKVLAFSCLWGGTAAFASVQEPKERPAEQQTEKPAPDNTKVNERDGKPGEPTADQQSNRRSDLEITQQIRKLVMKDKALSTYAHNVKIIAQDGMVTLKGPVRSDEEKRSVEAKAADVVGQEKVTSELAVKPKQ